MKIGFIGAGKVGKSFGKYLTNKGIAVEGYYSRSLKSAEEATKYVEGKVFTSLMEITLSCSMIFITTPDDEIKNVAQNIANEFDKNNMIIEGKMFIHMSGAHSSKSMAIIKERYPDNYFFSIHPLQAFADVTTAVADLKNTIFSVEGDQEKLSVITALIKTLGNKFFVIKGEDKALYHAAACVVSNYLVTLMDFGLELLEISGIEATEGFDALYPLIMGSLGNIKKLGTRDALTGPIARGDVNTIKNHIKAIEDKAPHLLSIYQHLGAETTKLAGVKKLKNPDHTSSVEHLNLLWKEGK